jgi:hypothetical protein
LIGLPLYVVRTAAHSHLLVHTMVVGTTDYQTIEISYDWKRFMTFLVSRGWSRQKIARDRIYSGMTPAGTDPIFLCNDSYV